MLFVALKETRLIDPVVLEVDLNVVCIPGTRFSDRNAASSRAVVSEDPQIVRFDVIFRPSQFAVPTTDRAFFQAEVPSAVPTSFTNTTPASCSFFYNSVEPSS